MLWVVRDGLRGEILHAKSLLSARNQNLAELLNAVKASCPVPVSGAVPDRQHSIRKAVEDVPRCAGCRTPLPDQALLWAQWHEFDQVPAPGLC
ncbi:Transposase OS=Nostoc sp. (strain PCC 7120 / UTEX 2576) GN=alr8566 PE=4 SV=1 [Gemmata massiliana]|uniref:Transposase n=1 Tax=Gemmata massiliana TaxID=1210884 RepID=A0A6P2DJB5_9BACT|nr:Transposase OS=Nostoc sp. (strain PCC 7120 / UTEX 2576) GN=alr8566 PE=4 SV=1 [Gemmata massiliana]